MCVLGWPPPSVRIVLFFLVSSFERCIQIEIEIGPARSMMHWVGSSQTKAIHHHHIHKQEAYLAHHRRHAPRLLLSPLLHPRLAACES